MMILAPSPASTCGMRSAFTLAFPASAACSSARPCFPLPPFTWRTAARLPFVPLEPVPMCSKYCSMEGEQEFLAAAVRTWPGHLKARIHAQPGTEQAARPARLRTTARMGEFAKVRCLRSTATSHGWRATRSRHWHATLYRMLLKLSANHSPAAVELSPTSISFGLNDSIPNGRT
jgi:hypothetical protein